MKKSSHLKTTKNIFSIVGMSLLTILIAAEITASSIMSSWLTSFFSGRGNQSSGYEQISYEADKIVRQIADEGVVLLKNKDNALPLEGVDKVNVFGWGSTNEGYMLSGSGSGSAIERGTGLIKPHYLIEGLEKSGLKTNKELTKIYTSFCSKKSGSKQSLQDPENIFFKLYEPSARVYTESVMKQCLDFSKTAIVCITRVGGEGLDWPSVQYKHNYATDRTRNYAQISTEEEELLDVVTNAGFEKVIVIINSTNTMELGFLNNDKIDAALNVGGVGQTGTIEIGRILKGEVNPSGKTSDTFTYDNAIFSPSYMHRKGNGVNDYTNGARYIDYREGVYVGYKWYETADTMNYFASVENEYGEGYEGAVQYPFGYGLSYTEFTWKLNSVSPVAGSTIKNGDKITLTVTVTNTGNRAGKDTVEVYYTAPYIKNGIEKPSVCLAAFAKTDLLKPSQKQTLTISFDVNDMKSYDYNDANQNGHYGYELESGTYAITLRTDAHNVAEMPKATTKYNVAETEFIDYDEVTGQRVENRFTGDNAYGGISIDGSNTNANIVYLSRKSFKTTFPKKRANRAREGKLDGLSERWFEDYNSYSMPTTGKTGDLRFVIKDENGNDSYNDELLSDIGSNYDSPTWDKLLDQITVNEMKTLVEMGGFQTVEIPSIGKPGAIDLDGPTGLNNAIATISSNTWTCYPIETTIGQTWNQELAEKMGESVAKEASASNVSGWYAPGANIHRDPFGGRNFEYFSEDALLSGKLSAGISKGALENGLYVYMKHFICYENAQGYLFTWLTEQSFREIYLRPFEIAIKEGGTNALMSSFGRVGGIWSGGHKALMTDVLRNEWGFRGSVLTDWSYGGDYMNPDQGLYAGNDIWLTGAQVAPSGHDDAYSARGVTYMRKATKNILYTYANTYYRCKDAGNNITFKAVSAGFPVWIFIVGGIVLVELTGMFFVLYFTLRRNNIIKNSWFKKGNKKYENK